MPLLHAGHTVGLYREFHYPLSTLAHCWYDHSSNILHLIYLLPVIIATCDTCQRFPTIKLYINGKYSQFGMDADLVGVGLLDVDVA